MTGPNITGREGKGEIREKTPVEASNWERMVNLIQTEFGEGRLAEEAMWEAVVLLPKGGNYYRGIGLVQDMWKVVADILNRRLPASITFNDFLYVFWAGHGTDTATLEFKLLQQLASLREEFLHIIFLDLHKAYDAL